ncbi:MAG: ABC transporter permease [Bryobacteraceae bacterium]|nr:ABC transporter permease [Bryobacteraceae bacterium]
MPHNWKEYVRAHLPALPVGPEREEEIVSELANQFEEACQEALRAGLDENAARLRAEEQVRDWNTLAAELRHAERRTPPPPMSGFAQDLRFSLRTLRRNPVFAAVAVVTLAFGIGANTAIFTVVDHIALRGLPYPDGHRLIDIEHRPEREPEAEPWCAIENFLDFSKRATTFDAVAAVSPVWNVVVDTGGEIERLETLFVSASFFPMLGVQPVAGRLFTADDDNRAQPGKVAVLSYALWQRRFGGAPDAVGRTVRIDNQAVTIIGVLPAGFRWRGEPVAGTATDIQLWAPLATNQLARSPRTLRFLKVTGRLRPGVTVEAAQAETRSISDALAAEHPAANKPLRFTAVPLAAKVTGRLRPALYLLLGAIGFVLLMVSANVANLLLARAATRTRELAIRVAIGASTFRLLRQLLTESLVIAVFGGVAGIAAAYVFLRLILAAGPPALLGGIPISVDWRALAFTAAVVLLTALLAGLWPALRAIQFNVREGRGITRGDRAARATLAAAQVSIALVLLVGAGLLLRSLVRVLEIPPGFDTRNLVSISTQVPSDATAPQSRINIYNTIRRELLATPGVQSVAAVSRLPLLGATITSQLHIEGRPHEGAPPEVEFRAATPGYFAAMAIPVRAGRPFEESDAADARIVIIDELVAKRHFPGEDPVGKRIRWGADSTSIWFTIVGVVGGVRHFGLESEPPATIYRPAAMNPLYSPIFVIRTEADPLPLLPALTRIVRTAHGRMPAYNVFSMEQLVARSTAQRRFLASLITIFAVAALLLACLGIYGTVSQSMAERTQEIGVRVALGASRADLLRLVGREAARIALPGLLLGLPAGFAAARLGRQLLYQIEPTDAAVFAVAAATLLVSVALACYIPARRAMAVDAVDALRQE